MKELSKQPAVPQSTPMILAFFAPGVVTIIAFVTLIAVNLVFNPTFWMTGDTEPVTPTPAVISIINQVLLFIGALGLVCLIPGIVIGIVLLVRRMRSSPRTVPIK